MTGRFQDLGRGCDILSGTPKMLEHTAPNSIGGFDHLADDPVSAFIRFTDP